MRQSGMVDAREPAAALGARGRSTRRLTAGLMLGVGVHAMEGFSIYTALPAMTVDLGARALYGAVITTYLLASLVGLVWAGVRTDTRGPRATLSVGLAAIGVGLLGATCAPHIAVLLVFRCFQGFGGGVLTTVMYAAVHQAYPRERWAATLAFLSLAWGVSAVAMPGLLGLIVDHVHWRLVFALGLPIAALAAVLILPALTALAAAGLPNEEASVDEGSRHADGRAASGVPPTPRRSARALSTSLSLVVLGAAVGFYGVPYAAGQTVPVVAMLLGAGVAVVVGLRGVWPPGVFGLRAGLPAAVGTKTLACALFFGAEAHLPLALTDIHQRGSTFVGLVLTASAMAWSSSAFLQARLLPRLGAAVVSLVGVLCVSLGVAGLLLLVSASVSPFLALPLWALASAGMAFVYNTTSDSALAETDEGQSGATGTALGISDSVGAAFGAGLASALLNGAQQAEGLSAGLGVGLLRGWLALLALALPMALGASRLGGRPRRSEDTLVAGSAGEARGPGATPS